MPAQKWKRPVGTKVETSGRRKVECPGRRKVEMYGGRKVECPGQRKVECPGRRKVEMSLLAGTPKPVDDGLPLPPSRLADIAAPSVSGVTGLNKPSHLDYHRLGMRRGGRPFAKAGANSVIAGQSESQDYANRWLEHS